MLSDWRPPMSSSHQWLKNLSNSLATDARNIATFHVRVTPFANIHIPLRQDKESIINI